MRISDWSSDVCSSDLHELSGGGYLLLSEDRSVKLRDPFYDRILPLLDGWMTGRQIVDRLVEGTSPGDQERAGQAEAFLASMIARKYVVSVEPWASTARTALRSAAGLSERNEHTTELQSLMRIA